MRRLSKYAIVVLLTLTGTATAAAATTTLTGHEMTAVAGGSMELTANEHPTSPPLMIRSDGGPDFTITKNRINQVHAGAYPSLFVGRFGDFVTNKDPFPLRLSSIKRDEVKTDVVSATPASTRSGTWADFYDIFLEPNPTASQFSSTREELVIWLNAANRSDSGPLVARNVGLDGHLYNIHGHRAAGRLGYVPRVYHDKFSGDLLPFIRNSIKRGYAHWNWYLVEVSHGFEVDHGPVVGLGDRRFGVTVGSRTIGR